MSVAASSPAIPVAVAVVISEAPSNASSMARTIHGVATAIAAFVGRALRGPVDEPVTITSYADFECLFGGLWGESALGYAVRDFYVNGGTRAIIVRLYHPPAAVNHVVASHALIRTGALVLQARDPGAWGNALQVRIDHDVKPLDSSAFNLTVRDAASGQIEVFRNVSVSPLHPRRVDQVLRNLSRLVIMRGALPGTRPASHAAAMPGRGDSWQQGGATSTGVLTFDRAGTEQPLTLADFHASEKLAAGSGLYALARAELFNVLCIPPYLPRDGDMLDGDVDQTLIEAAAQFCEQRRAILLVDPPSSWTSVGAALTGVASLGTASANAALFFPRLLQLVAQRDGAMTTLVPCGAIAGILARTDSQRGVWKAPAGMEAAMLGVPALSVPMSDAETAMLNPRAINCLRTMPAAGRILWGARTLQGSDAGNSQWKYIPVRRTALFIEESLQRGTRWAMAEPNDETLWAQMRLHVNAFMYNLFRQGAFQGRTARDAYFVKCDRDTTTDDELGRGVVNIMVGFAPLQPGEFVVIAVQQRTG